MNIKKSLLLSMIALGTIGVSACSKKKNENNDSNQNQNIVDEGVLNEKKTNACNELDTHKVTGLGAFVDDGTIEAAVTAGKESINSATTELEVESALSTAKASVTNAINTLKADIDSAKTNAKNELEEYADALLEGITDDGSISSAVTAGKTAINSALSKDAISTALQNAKTAVYNASVEINADIAALATARTEAKNDINTYVDNLLGDYIDDGSIEEALNLGLLAIDAATTINDVETVLNNAKTSISTAINTLISSVDNARTNAKAGLEEYAQEQLTNKDDDGTVAAAVAAGKTAIDVAYSVSDVQDALTTAKANVEAAASILVVKTLIYNNTFDTDTTVDCIGEGETATSNLFGATSNNATDFTASNSVNVSNGTLNVLDTDTSNSTYAFIDIETINLKTVYISMDFSASVKANKWNIVTLLDSNDKELLGVRTINDYIDMRVDGSSNTGVGTNKTVAFAANTNYKIDITIDLKNYAVTLVVNGVTVGTTYIFVEDFSKIKFETSQSGSRNSTIDNVSIKTSEYDLDELKTYTATQLESYVLGKVEPDYSASNWQLMTTTYSNAIAAINNATTNDELIEIFISAKNILKGILSIIEEEKIEFNKYVELKVSEITYDSTLYSAENSALIEEDVNKYSLEIYDIDFDGTITLADAKESIDTIVSNFNAKLATYKTLAEEYQDEAEKIDALINALPASNATYLELLGAESEIEAVYATYTNALNEIKLLVQAEMVTKLNDVKDALAVAKESATPIDLFEGNVVNYLDQLDKAYLEYDLTKYTMNGSDLEDIYLSYKTQINALLEQAKLEVEFENLVSSYETSLENLYTEAISSLANVKDDVTQSKADKKTSLDEVYNENLGNYSQEYNLNSYNEQYERLATSINACTTIQEVEAITFDSMLQVLTDAEQIEYNNIPEIIVQELQEVEDTSEFIQSKPATSVTVKTPTKYGEFIVSNGTADKFTLHKDGYLSLKEGGTITFTINYDGGSFEAIYTSTSNSRFVTLACDALGYSSQVYHSEFTSVEGTTYKSVKFTDLKAGTYVLTAGGGENKIGILIRNDKKLVDETYKLEGLDVMIGENPTTDIVFDSIIVNAVYDTDKKATLNISDVTIKFYDSATSAEVTELVAGTYNIVVSYKTEGLTGEVVKVIENVVIG